MAIVADKSGNTVYNDPALKSSGFSEDSFVSEYLVNSSGSNDLGIDGTTPITFSYTVPISKELVAGRFIIYLESALAMDSIEFGNLTALTNGVSIVADGVEIANWKDNVDMLSDMFDLNPAGTAFGKQTQTLAGRWTFYKAKGSSLGIEINSSIGVIIQDDLNTLVVFRIKVQGILIDRVR
jgi:hypothetical protein